MNDENNTDPQTAPKIMSAESAVRIISELEELGIKTILDGGWGIDALLESQTREHTDIDFLVESKDFEKLKEYLDKNRFEQTDKFNKWWHMSFENESLIIDTHVIEFDEVGKAIYGPKIRDDFPFPGIFPAYALKGTGKINGKDVNCLSAEYRVRCQTRVLLNLMPDNYKHVPTKKDYDDLAKLCKKFDMEMPPELLPLEHAS
jgi:lincosamide nucleotidyltransferase A/C/D/E